MKNKKKPLSAADIINMVEMQAGLDPEELARMIVTAFWFFTTVLGIDEMRQNTAVVNNLLRFFVSAQRENLKWRLRNQKFFLYYN
jgi:hypothetical protein